MKFIYYWLLLRLKNCNLLLIKNYPYENAKT